MVKYYRKKNICCFRNNFTHLCTTTTVHKWLASILIFNRHLHLFYLWSRPLAFLWVKPQHNIAWEGEATSWFAHGVKRLWFQFSFQPSPPTTHASATLMFLTFIVRRQDPWIPVVWVRVKVIYTKYSKHWPYTVAHTIECVCIQC